MRFVIIISFILLFIPVSAIGFEIIGVGDDPSLAYRDGLRQISECFGGVALWSETNVVNFQTERDVIDLKTSFRGANLDRFYKGVRHVGPKYFARFEFSDRFLSGVHNNMRDYSRARLVISFNVISYVSEATNTFGEVKRRDFKIRIPSAVRKFVDFFILDIDDSKGLEWVWESG